jgi:hypothetical protein
LTKYQPDIDGMRAVAVLAVMLFNTFPNISPGGFVGVDIFSVISSYLIKQIITNDLEKWRFTIANFYTRRLRRIFPALILVLIAQSNQDHSDGRGRPWKAFALSRPTWSYMNPCVHHVWCLRARCSEKERPLAKPFQIPAFEPLELVAHTDGWIVGG